jgi:hypothetical protein
MLVFAWLAIALRAFAGVAERAQFGIAWSSSLGVLNYM